MSAPTSDRAGITQTIDALLAGGYHLVAVNDSEERIPVETKAEALEAIMGVDDAVLIVAEGTPTGPKGWVRFVLGNDPDEVICDYTISLDSVIDPLMDRWDQ